MFIKLLFDYRGERTHFQGEWTRYRETFGSLRSKFLQNRQKCQFKSEKRSRKIINLWCYCNDMFLYRFQKL